MSTSKVIFGLCLLLSSPAVDMARAADKVWYGGTGDWTNADDWLPAGVPVDADTVLISNGVLVVGADVSIASVGLHGGTLTGSGVLVATNGTWTRGAMAGSGVTLVPPGGQWQLSGSADKTLADRMLANAGTVVWDGGAVHLQGEAVFSNLVSGTFDVALDGLWVKDSFGWTIYNAGLWRKSAGAGTAEVQDFFNNSGKVEVQSGTLEISSGGGGGGSFTLGSGTALNFKGGTYTLTEGARISGNGLVSVTGATVDFNSTNLAIASLVVAGGAANFNAGAGVGNLQFAGGTLGGTNTLVATNGAWTDGVMTGTGATVIPAGGLWEISGSANKALSDRLLANAGTVLWNGGEIHLQGEAVFSNLVSGIFDVAFDGLWVKDNPWWTIYNAGLWRKSAGAGTNTIADTFLNSGTVEVDSGSLSLSSGGGGCGGFALSSGSALEFSGGTYTLAEGAGISGNGLVRVVGATVNFNSSNLNLAALTLASGAANFNAGAGVGNLQFVGGTLGGTNTLVATNGAWTDGVMTGTGATVIPAGGLWEISGSANKALSDRLLANAGTVLWNGGEIHLQGEAVFSNLVTGTFDVGFDGLWVKDNPWWTIYNAGLWRKSAGVGTNTIADTFLNSGTVEVDSGSLSLSSGGGGCGGFALSSGSALEFSGGTYTLAEGAGISGNGQVRVAGATVNFNSSNLNLAALTLAGGAANFNAGAGVGNLQFAGGTLGGTNTLVATNGAWTDGVMTGTGATVIPAGGLWEISGSANKALSDRLLANAGTVLWNGGEIHLQGEAVFSNLVTGTFDVSFDGLWVKDSLGWTIYNAGLWRKSAGTGTAEVQDFFNNSGTVEAQAGTIKLSSGFLEGASGTLSFGLQSPTNFGRVVVPDTVNFSGRLCVTLLDGYLPATNSSFEVMTFTSYSGDFTDTSCLVSNTAVQFRREFTPTTLLLRTTAGSTNEPGVPDVASCVVSKGQAFVQAGPVAPVPVPNTPFEFRSFVYPATSNSIVAVTGQTPLGETGPMPWSEFWHGFAGWTTATNQGELDARFPTGVYTASITTAHEGMRVVPVNLPSGDYPNAPEVEHWAAAQAVNPASDFALQWNEFSGGTSNDFVRVYVIATNGSLVFSTPATPGQPGSLDGANRCTVIPADTLPPQQSFLGVVAFFRIVLVETNAYPGAVCISSYYAFTQFGLQTTSPPVLTQDVKSHAVGKGQGFTQTDAADPVPTATPFHFHAFVRPATSNSVLAATELAPLGETNLMQWSDFFQGFVVDIGLVSRSDLDQRFPIGPYTASITTADEGLKVMPVNLPAGAFPNAPHVQNWTAGQNLDTTSDFTLQWDPFVGGTTNDVVRLYISGVSGTLLFNTPETSDEPGMLDGTCRQAVIPANTLPPEQIISATLLFYRVVATDTNACPGALCLATYYTFTRFALQTAATNAPPTITGQPVGQAVPAGSSVTFCVSATGTPPPVYQWRKDGQPRVGATNSCLLIGSAAPSDTGGYDVVVVNLAGCRTSEVATLAVFAPTLTNYAWTTLAGQPGSPEQFAFPFGVAVDGATNVYVSDRQNHRICKVLPDGSVTTLAGLKGVAGNVDGIGTGARFNTPHGVAVDTAGNVYVADFFNSTIRRITPDGDVSTMTNASGAPALFSAPIGVAVDLQGAVYVAEETGQTIRKITTNGLVTLVAGTPGQRGSADGPSASASFDGPHNLTVDLAGDVFVADYGDHTIRKITPAAMVSTVAGFPGVGGSADGPTNLARFYSPRGVAADAQGNIFVGDHGNCTIRMITPDGMVSTIGGLAGHAGTADGTGSASRFDLPSSIAVSCAGVLYVADQGNGLVRRGQPLFIGPSQPLQLHPPLRSGASLLLSWDAGSGLSLQVTTNLYGSVWQEVPGSRATNFLSLPLTEPAAFFRLKQD